MEKSQAQISSKKLMGEIFSLTPSTMVTFFEIDINSMSLDLGVTSTSDSLFNINAGIIRFHNNIRLLNTSLFWQGNEYVALPVEAEGFEFTSKGTPPTPKLRIAVNDNGIDILTTMKKKIYDLGDLVGAKITRIRTFVKYLDAKNYINEILPDPSYDPDPNVELPRDVYYVDRKSTENKNIIEFELSTIFDIEGIKLPGRLMTSNKCMHQYRGEGCCYEYASRQNAIHNGATLPSLAPPIANENDEKIVDILNITETVDRGQWQKDIVYLKGDCIYITKNNLNYYFIARVSNPPVGPPNGSYWIADICSKGVRGCKLRWSSIQNTLPFGGFPAINKLGT